MPIESQIDDFELNGSQPARPALLCFQVGEQDWVAAVDEAGARQVLEEMNGEEPGAYHDWDVELTSESMLDKQWVDEDPPHAECGCLRQWLAEANEPTYLAGVE
ncbi:hypothetical protein GIW45_11320 [Pseudomonas congelans]|uniref:hypothetical protein n=1 Tax=Pseudomonas congelans TaxID=200452 RepID=UPI001F464C08|nr:hypothetical protein [Pseudomonas congelans]MCF5164644.1 hypothetical protein [Pseudomonas congelans]